MPKISDQKTKEEMPWEERAKINPLYTVMSADQFEDKDDDPNKWTKRDLKLFFDKGQRIFDFFVKPAILRTGMDKKRALIVEYGSGMGRILKAVSEAGFRCAGIDVSPTLLKHSKKLVPKVKKLFLLNKKNLFPMKNACANLVYSFAVLQHIPKLHTLQTAINEMCRILKPGGIIRIQYYSIDLPFYTNRKFVTKRQWLFNFENKSFVLGWKKYKGTNPMRKLLSVELIFRRIQHNYWLGVPFSFANLSKTFHENRMILIGIEQDLDRSNMYWVTARKLA